MIKFYNYNLVNQPQTVITATNENASFPISNLKDDRTTKVFRSTSNSSQIIFDFITTEPVDSIVLVPNSINGWGMVTPITIEANATSNFTSPAFTTTIASFDQENEVAFKEISEQNYRFWRLSINGTSFCELSKIFIGKSLTIGDRGPDLSWTFVDQDSSEVIQNKYGTRFIDTYVKQKSMQMSFSYLDKDELDSLLEIADYNSITKPLFLRIDCPDILNNVNRFAGYFYMSNSPQILNPSYSLYSTSLSFVEAK
jgi:hypothetical protein